GAAGCDQNPAQGFANQTYVASGVDGTPFGIDPDGGSDAGEQFEVATAPLGDTVGVINPGDGGAAPLVTVEADELGIGSPQPLPCTIMNTNVGAMGTSTVIFVGLPVENLQSTGPYSSSTVFFDTLQACLP